MAKLPLSITACLLSASIALSAADKTVETDTISLGEVGVVAKSATRRIAEGALTVNAINVRPSVNRLVGLNRLVGRSAGVNIRRQGGAGSDLEFSINGLSGNSIRYFIDGMPLDSRGGEVTLDNIPLNTVERVELYKGVVPAHLGADALGGAVNIVTRNSRRPYLDASYGFGSFGTHTVDLTGQVGVPGTKIVVRPTFGLVTSRNNYVMRDVEVWSEEEDRYIITDKCRFHDGFFSLLAQIEAGITDVAWADRMFVGASFTKIDKEIQTGAMQNKVYGLPERHSDAWSVSLNYLKRLGAVNTRLAASHTWDRSETVDTAYRKYSWDGTWLPSSGNEMTGKARTIRTYHRPLTVVNAGVDYTLLPGHVVSVNYLLNRRGNRRTDKVDKTFDPSNDILLKHILSLTYSLSMADDRLSAQIFGKEYINSATIRQRDNFTVTGADLIEPHTVRHYEGGGVGARYTLLPQLAAKASFEHSVRLPLSREMLGNGTTVLPNVALRPESSNNVNAGIFGTWRPWADHTFTYEVNGFLRHVQNYIRATVSERDGMMQYVNQPAVAVKGIDFDVAYEWSGGLRVGVNGTFNDARDLRRYKSDGNPSATYRNRVPNRPWLFGNISASYRLDGLRLLTDDHLSVRADAEWTHWYYLNWEAFGAASSKARIPVQTIVSLSATYSWHTDRYNLTVGCDNLFDRPAYDNYMLQKPGRSFDVKFRLFLE